MGNIDRVLRPQIEQPFSDRIFMNPVAVAENALGNTGGDGFPGPAVICRFVDEGIAVVHLVKVDGNVGLGGVELGWLDVADCPPFREVGDVVGDVGPVGTTVACDV